MKNHVHIQIPDKSTIIFDEAADPIGLFEFLIVSGIEQYLTDEPAHKVSFARYDHNGVLAETFPGGWR